MQPYKWCGRFYNNKHDSIVRRLKNFVRSFLYVTGHQVLKSGKKQKSCAQKEIFRNHHLKSPKVEGSTTITWLGHSTFIIEAGITLITDPVFSSKFPVFSRRIPLPLAPENIPAVDAVIISHNHKDHLDLPSIKKLNTAGPVYLVPMGNRRMLNRHGCRHVVEKNWWEAELIQNTINLTFLPAIHWTSRGILDINKTLWGSWLIETPEKKIYFAGDTAYGEHFSLIAQRFGAIDIAIMPIGPNEPRQFIAEAHMNAPEAVQAFIDLKAQHFIPMHWGTFKHMGTEEHDNPLQLLKKTWAARANDLEGRQLHVVSCGEKYTF